MSVALTAKEAAKKKLIKDLIVGIITTVVVFLVLIAVIWIGNVDEMRTDLLADGFFAAILATIGLPILVGYIFASVVAGMRFWNKRLITRNLIAWFIKYCLAVLTGYVIFLIVVIKDIIAYVKA